MEKEETRMRGKRWQYLRGRHDALPPMVAGLICPDLNQRPAY
jgi:hypothetical protein